MSAQEELKKADESAASETQASDSGYSVNVSGGESNRVNVGKLAGKGGIKGKVKKFLPLIVTAGIILILFLFLGGNFIPDAILTRLVEETDVQYADAVQSKELVFQNALQNGKIPTNTAERLEEEGITVGYMDGDTFVASNVSPALVASNDSIYLSGGTGTPLSLKMKDGKIITANEFYKEVNENVELYNAFTQSTYGRAAYYYDEKAQQVFKKIGTDRNNFTADEDLEDTMDKLLGAENTVGFKDETWHYMPNNWSVDPKTGAYEVIGYESMKDYFNCSGSGISSINNWRVPIIAYSPPEDTDGDGVADTEGYYYWTGETEDVLIGEYGCSGISAEAYMKSMAQANMSEDSDEKTIKNTTDSLKAADTISKEQKSMLLYSGFMESISRMKAGYGKASTETDKIIGAFGTFGTVNGGSKINDVMNKLYKVETSYVVDVETGQKVKLVGSMLESPSVYSILAGEKVNLEDVNDFSSDRILKTINNNTDYDVGDDIILRTATTKSDGNKSAIGRYTEIDTRKTTPSGREIKEAEGENYNWGDYDADNIGLVELTVKNSLFSSYGEINGILAGEMLAEGAVNVGKELAKASGAAAGDESVVTAYLQLNSDVLAMDAAADRLNRSPLDITSKNTFLGSIVYKFAVASVKSGGILNKVASLSRITNSTIASMLPATYAAEEDENEAYLSTFGECDTLNTIGATGSPTCSMIATFDTTTYDGIYQDQNFINYINKNVECDSTGVCEIIDKDSKSLAKYVNYNENRNTPVGLTDGAIVESVKNSESVFKKIWNAVANLFNTIVGIDNGEVPDEATGKAFVDSAANNDWNNGEQYKYAQRYISLARAAETMRQYDGDETAYVFEGFGKGDPVARYIDKLNQDSIAVSD